MATFTQTDTGRTCTITCEASYMPSSELTALLGYVRELDLRAQIKECLSDGTTATVNLTDGRAFATTLTSKEPIRFAINCSQEGFSSEEFELLRNICTLVNSWYISHGLTSLTAAYK